MLQFLKEASSFLPLLFNDVWIFSSNTVYQVFHMLLLIVMPFTRFLDLTSVVPFVGSSTCYKVETEGFEDLSKDESKEEVEIEAEENSIG